MRGLDCEDMGLKVDGRQLHHIRFADDIVLITPSISQAGAPRVSGSRSQHGQRPSAGAEQEETSGLMSFQERRRSREEDEERSTPLFFLPKHTPQRPGLYETRMNTR
ncbi:unnamed protein product [Heligmosomoides polygyrus]|uniref:Reverse transcriptase domain-containing protein n=1 Tax=Heligmosomoides polygyrus TaxID=6339 RepID=A0A183GUW8_HELPZ|nr:unnamed protein product [Heligmosomoides polygyrus]